MNNAKLADSQLSFLSHVSHSKKKVASTHSRVILMKVLYEEDEFYIEI